MAPLLRLSLLPSPPLPLRDLAPLLTECLYLLPYPPPLWSPSPLPRECLLPSQPPCRDLAPLPREYLLPYPPPLWSPSPLPGECLLPSQPSYRELLLPSPQPQIPWTTPAPLNAHSRLRHPPCHPSSLCQRILPPNLCQRTFPRCRRTGGRGARVGEAKTGLLTSPGPLRARRPRTPPQLLGLLLDWVRRRGVRSSTVLTITPR